MHNCVSPLTQITETVEWLQGMKTQWPSYTYDGLTTPPHHDPSLGLGRPDDLSWRPAPGMWLTLALPKGQRTCCAERVRCQAPGWTPCEFAHYAKKTTHSIFRRRKKPTPPLAENTPPFTRQKALHVKTTTECFLHIYIGCLSRLSMSRVVFCETSVNSILQQRALDVVQCDRSTPCQKQ